MANSPLVSIRIPPETLERIDQLAQKLYPPRRAGKTPNRSQVILDAINQFLEQHEINEVGSPDTAKQSDEQQLQDAIQIEPVDDQQNQTVLQSYPQPIPEHQADEPLVREYIDWWFDYFSYMKKFSDTWFKSK